jgi:hypothetical protein
MSEQSKAWIWSQYKGFIADSVEEKPPQTSHASYTNDRVVPIRPKLEEAFDRGDKVMTINRAKYGILIAVAVLAGLFFPLLAIVLLAIAGLLIASGREPQKTEEFLASIPGGSYVTGLLSQFDSLLS